MAARNFSCGTRLNGRLGGNRPRTHPSPKRRRKPAPPKPSADALRISLTALRRVQGKLAVIRSTAVVTARQLRDQNCESDADAATVLGIHVVDALSEQMMQIGLLFGEDEHDERGAS